MKYLISIVLLLTHWQLFAFKDEKSVFYFDSDIDTLNQQQYRELVGFIGKTTATKQYKEIYVVGFTDADGSNQYNIDLSKRRADFVSKQLVKNGLPEVLIDKNFKGEDNPIAKNNTEENKSKNRRVEITMRLFDIQNAADVVKEINGNPEQVFTLDNTQTNFIEGKNGIRFIFPPFCFNIKGNKKSDFQQIKIVLTEVMNPIQGFFSNVLAESNNKLLQSGGMFKITAYLNDVELKMKSNMEYVVQINNNNLQNDMTVFMPNTQQLDGLTRWENSAVAFEKTSSFKGVRPTLELDKDIIKNWHVQPKLDSVLKNFAFILPNTPIKPAYPKKPFPPFEPKITAYKYKLPWYKKAFMSKAKQKRVIQENYNKDLEVYMQSRAVYETKLKKFAEDTLIYKEKLADYQFEYKVYKEELKQKIKDADLYRLALYENAFLKGFEYAKNAVLYRMQNNTLYSHNIYGDMLNQCNKLSRLKDVNPYYADLFGTYAKSLKTICEKEFPNSSYYFSFNVMVDEHSNKIYPYSYLTAFLDLMKEDKTVLKHIETAQTTLQEAEIKLGLFNPANFRTYYQASLANFGWINCDRFANYKQDEIFTLQIPNYKLKDQNMFAIVKDINSQISIPLSSNNMRSIDLPKNKEIVVVAIGLDDQLNPQIAKYTLNSDKNVHLNLQFKTAKLSEIKEMIQSI
jgi:hypothetical protein